MNNNHDKHFLPFTISIGLLLLIAVIGCQPNKNVKTTSDNQDSTAVAQNEKESTSNQKITQVHFPHYIKGIDALIHPVTLAVTDEYKEELSNKKSRKNKSYQAPFTESETYNYRTNVSNLIFEEIATGDTQSLLPNHNFIISHVFLPYIKQYRQALFENATNNEALDMDNVEVLNGSPYPTYKKDTQIVIATPLNHFIYHINETPDKQDDKVKNLFKQQALYMSDSMGKQLTKLHPDNEYVQTTEWMPQISRYYFITQSDSNGNGLIDEKDTYHNYQIDFSKDTPIVQSYDFEKYNLFWSNNETRRSPTHPQRYAKKVGSDKRAYSQ